jgi:pimeloyl-ACP methyl ester carboxylesterase
MRLSVLSNPPKDAAHFRIFARTAVGLWLRSMNNASPRLRRAYFECRHGQLHVHNAIPDGGGFDELTTLLCLHGGAGSGRMFLELSKRLGNSRSIYSPDLPGCGESDAAAGPLSVSAYAEAIGDFLDSMRFRQVDLLGAGAGAAVAVELAAARPKVVRKVCLVGLGKKEGGPGVALESAAAAWQPDRLALVKQPVSRVDSGSFETGAEALSKQVESFFAA